MSGCRRGHGRRTRWSIVSEMLASSYLESASACASARAAAFAAGKMSATTSLRSVSGASFEAGSKVAPSLVGARHIGHDDADESRWRAEKAQSRQKECEHCASSAHGQRTGSVYTSQQIAHEKASSNCAIDLPLHSFLPSTLSQSPRSMVMVAGIFSTLWCSGSGSSAGDGSLLWLARLRANFIHSISRSSVASGLLRLRRPKKGRRFG